MTEKQVKSISELMGEFAMSLPQYQISVTPEAHEGSVKWRTVVAATVPGKVSRILLDVVSHQKWLDDVAQVIEVDR